MYIYIDNIEKYTLLNKNKTVHIQDSKNVYFLKLLTLDVNKNNIIVVFNNNNSSIKLNNCTIIITKSPNLRKLHLTSSKIKQLSFRHKRYDNLIELNISNIKILAPLKLDVYMPNLEKLVLKNNGLDEFPSCIFTLQKLQHLTIINDNITYIPNDIIKLSNLKYLDISNWRYSHYNQIEVYIPFPNIIWNMFDLEELHLSNLSLISLSNNIGRLTNLKLLNLYDNNIDSLPASLTKLTKLTTINISVTHIKYLGIINKLPQLQTIIAHHSRFYTIDESFSKLTNLTHLDLCENYTTYISPAISNLQKLEILDLSVNDITTLPSSFGKLTSLTKLYLTKTDMYDENNVYPIDISNCNFGNLTNLTNLNLELNFNIILPNTITNLVKLTALNLGFTDLISIDLVTKLTNLTDLNLECNKLTSVDSIINLTNLIYLRIDGNKLTSLPTTFSRLVNLNELIICDKNLIKTIGTIGNIIDTKTMYCGDCEESYE